MRVLVTGGAGYIGSVAVELLVARGDDVVVLDNLWRGHAAAIPPGIELLDIDLQDRTAVGAAIGAAAPDAVVHFAAATLVPESVVMPAEYFGINVTGALNVLSAMAEVGVPKFVFSSTAAVYGNAESVPIGEDAPVRPINPYGLSKLTIERMLPAFAEAYGLCYVIFRYFNVAGATEERGEDHRPETHIIPVALRTLLGKQSVFKLFGTDYPTPDGTAIRDYVHVRDLVDAHLLALDRLDSPLGVYNLGTRDGFSVRNIVDTVERVTGRSLPIAIEARRPGDPAQLVADSTRAELELGWSARHSTLEDMISSTWDWMQRNPDGYHR